MPNKIKSALAAGKLFSPLEVLEKKISTVRLY